VLKGQVTIYHRDELRGSRITICGKSTLQLFPGVLGYIRSLTRREYFVSRQIKDHQKETENPPTLEHENNIWVEDVYRTWRCVAQYPSVTVTTTTAPICILRTSATRDYMNKDLSRTLLIATLETVVH
jgi:hypothetical protein